MICFYFVLKISGEAKNLPSSKDCYCTVHLDQEEVYRTGVQEKTQWWVHVYGLLKSLLVLVRVLKFCEGIKTLELTWAGCEPATFRVEYIHSHLIHYPQFGYTKHGPCLPYYVSVLQPWITFMNTTIVNIWFYWTWTLVPILCISITTMNHFHEDHYSEHLVNTEHDPWFPFYASVLQPQINLMKTTIVNIWLYWTWPLVPILCIGIAATN